MSNIDSDLTPDEENVMVSLLAWDQKYNLHPCFWYLRHHFKESRRVSVGRYIDALTMSCPHLAATERREDDFDHQDDELLTLVSDVLRTHQEEVFHVTRLINQ